jgi:anti-sigma regulatory factor (Ser/Thr protein kinase)
MNAECWIASNRIPTSLAVPLSAFRIHPSAFRRMNLQLLFPNAAQVLPSISAFTRETLRQYPFDDATADQIAQCVLAAAQNAVDHAYPAGEQGEIKLSVSETHGKLEFLIRDDGLPQDVETLERRLHDPQLPAGSHALDWPGLDAVDEIHWIGYGREGKAIQIIKWLHDSHIAADDATSDLSPFNKEAPPRSAASLRSSPHARGRSSPNLAADVPRLRQHLSQRRRLLS